MKRVSGFAIAFMVVAAVFFCWGVIAMESCMRKQAVAYGVAEWVIIENGPSVEFRWKTQNPKP
jgi:hypothetical protein